MRLDGHIHAGLVRREYVNDPDGNRKKLMDGLHAAGLDGGVVLSVDPLTYPDWEPEKRLKDCLDLCTGEKTLFPFYYLNPLESDAADQIDLACTNGIMGFKMICSEYAPYDECCLKACERIARHNKPVLFHSGICWDGLPSANYNKPSNFEAMLQIPGLKFTLAHVSWPWYDECIAVFGKFRNAWRKNPEESCEMFIDVAPGTPAPYREEVFTRLLSWSTYDLRNNLIFGTDNYTSSYDVTWAKEWQERDDALYRKLIPEGTDDFLDHVYRKNILRFMGI